MNHWPDDGLTDAQKRQATEILHPSIKLFAKETNNDT